MLLTVQQSIIIILTISVGTFLTRSLPFILFPANRETPKFVLYLGEVLPFACISLLIVYCLKNVSLLSAPHGLPEAIAITAIVLVHLWKNNVLLSIGGGTLLYMLLVQFIFV
ncbi:branched-chain amino acid transporter permease [Desulfitobacterium sp.]|uniref:branched-chain amino acid transporter permease n=1 Tax=Desulfitobacterium sp. TaxID=49981 RepID=UPI002B204FF5|nr:AzlD domain-containing protein [Desulfitobacterium sp.]MEA4900793.1 AzlD domain-containing protein [Desulfitobacterium sp.]